MNLHVNSNLALELPSDVAPSSFVSRKKIDRRAELASQFIPAGARVLDLSGSAAIQRLLPGSCSYCGIDRTRRAVVACDLNTGDFPTEVASQSDVIVMLGVLERITDIESLFTHLRFCKRDIILSYYATDLGKDVNRASLGYANHLSFRDLALLFDRYGFRIECTTPIDGAQVLMRLRPTK